MKIYARRKPEKRFWDLVLIIPFSECWIWIGETSQKGYGKFHLGIPYSKKYQYAHRYSLGLTRKLDQSKVIDHICRNRACVNPEHLREVSQYQNTIENSLAIPAINKIKTHCIHGHAFTKENTKIRAKNKGRDCRVCRRISNSKYKKKNASKNISAT